MPSGFEFEDRGSNMLSMRAFSRKTWSLSSFVPPAWSACLGLVTKKEMGLREGGFEGTEVGDDILICVSTRCAFVFQFLRILKHHMTNASRNFKHIPAFRIRN
jgi:hypothetical protein